MTNSNVIEIYTDGACSGNPGPGGLGIVMKYKDQRKELAYGFKLTTNNLNKFNHREYIKFYW